MDNVKKQGILAVIGSVFAIFLPGSLVFGFPGIMRPIWSDMLMIESGALSYVLFFLIASLGIFMFFVGKWTGILGVRKLMIIGTIVTSFATIMVAFASSIFTIYLWAFLIGGASCFIYSPGVNTVQRWFPHKRGLVSGIVNLTFGISAAIMAPFYGKLIHIIGYRSLCIYLGIVVLIVGIIASSFTELPDKNTSDKLMSKISKSNNKSLEFDIPPKNAVKTKNFWLIWGVWALMGGAGVSMTVLSVDLGLHLGYELVMATTILTAFNLTNGFSRIISGWISDIIGRQLTLSITFFLAGIAYFVLVISSNNSNDFISSLTMLWILAAIIGFAYGTLFSCSSPMISECFGLSHFGIMLGLVFTGYGFVASILGPALSGYLVHLTSEFTISFLYLGLFSIISGVMILFVDTPKAIN